VIRRAACFKLAWTELGVHILWEAVSYGGWVDDVPRSSMHLFTDEVLPNLS
jgi:hypothetical protein